MHTDKLLYSSPPLYRIVVAAAAVAFVIVQAHKQIYVENRCEYS
jgi:hypothetical protein